jgi:hypothetical protein
VNGSRELVPDRSGKAILDSARHCFVCPSAEEAPRGGLEALTNGEDLVRGLPLTKDDLGRSLAQVTVVIDAGEDDVFEGEMTELLESGLGSNAARGNVGEERLELLCCHAT